MKIIISPAKSLDFETKVATTLHSQPQFIEKSTRINRKLKTISRNKISEMMSISKDLATLNYHRNQDWQPPFDLDNAKQAIYAFSGEVYRGIDIHTLKEEKLPILQERLRILSGLYGMLKPLDLIQPYRLEMGTRLKVGRTENLYKFWGNTLTDALNEEISDDEPLINLASAEYFKAINTKKIKTSIITPVFKDYKNGHYKTIMTFAKKARGVMTRYIIDKNIKTIEELKNFDVDGYRFSAPMSAETALVFTR